MKLQASHARTTCFGRDGTPGPHPAVRRVALSFWAVSLAAAVLTLALVRRGGPA